MNKRCKCTSTVQVLVSFYITHRGKLECQKIRKFRNASSSSRIERLQNFPWKRHYSMEIKFELLNWKCRQNLFTLKKWDEKAHNLLTLCKSTIGFIYRSSQSGSGVSCDGDLGKREYAVGVEGKELDPECCHNSLSTSPYNIAKCSYSLINLLCDPKAFLINFYK